MYKETKYSVTALLLGCLFLATLVFIAFVATADAQVEYYVKTVEAIPNDAGDVKVHREHRIYEFTDSLTCILTGEKLGEAPTEEQCGGLMTLISDSTFVKLAVEVYIYATTESQEVVDGITYVTTAEGALESVEFWGYKRIPDAGSTNQLVQKSISQLTKPPKDVTEAKTRYTTHKTDIDTEVTNAGIEIQKPFEPK